MKSHWIWILFLSFLLPNLSFAKEDCSCPVVSCGPCQKEVQIGKKVKFCSWGDINVCKKTICENVSGYFKCLTDQGGKKQKPVAEVIELPQKDMVLLYEEKVKRKTKKKKRAPSSVRYIDEKEKDRPIDFNPEGLVPIEDASRNYDGEIYSDKVVAKISKTHKDIELQQGRAIFPPKKNHEIHVGDILTNPKKQGVPFELKFPFGTIKLRLSAGGQVRFKDPESIEGRFQPFLHLVYGDLRIEGQMDQGLIDVLAGQVLLRFHKGVAFVEYKKINNELLVNMESHRGEVKVLQASNLASPGISVPAGSSIQWRGEQLAATETSEGTAPETLSEGVVTPVFQMPLQKRMLLGLIPKDPKSEFKDWKLAKGDRLPASADGASASLCQQPSGGFESCAWTCEDGKKGAKTCRSQENNSRCVRRQCNANGQWGTPTAFESSYSDLCPAEGTRVGSCAP